MVREVRQDLLPIVPVENLAIFLSHIYVRYCYLGLSDFPGELGGTTGLNLNHLVGLFYPEIGSDPFHYVPP